MNQLPARSVSMVVKRVTVAVSIAVLCAVALYIETTRLQRIAPAHEPGVLRIVILGDSVAHGAGDESGHGIALDLEQQLGSRVAAITNLGVNGARTFDVQRLLRTTAAQSIVRAANSVIVSIGGNDLYGDPAARLWTALWPSLAMHRIGTRIESLVARIHTINPTVRVILLGLYDPYRRSSAGAFLDVQVNRWDAMLIRRFAADPTVTVIRIADLFATRDRLSPLDHFHPSAAGYSFIAARIAPAL